MPEPKLYTRSAGHKCPTPPIGDSPERIWPNGAYLLDGDVWTCECGVRWVARTLWWRRGAPMIWVRPAPWMAAWWSTPTEEKDV